MGSPEGRIRSLLEMDLQRVSGGFCLQDLVWWKWVRSGLHRMSVSTAAESAHLHCETLPTTQGSGSVALGGNCVSE